MTCRTFIASAAFALALGLAACSQPPHKSEQSLPTAPHPAPRTPPPTSATEPEAILPEPVREERYAAQDAVVEKQRALGAAQGRAASALAYAPAPHWTMPSPQMRERYAHIQSHTTQRVAENPVSTFSVDVDTGSYANVRRFLEQGQLPPQDAVRVEELINYFDYAYPAPRDRGRPFGFITHVVPTPWNPKTHLLHVGIQAWADEPPPEASNLVFLVDVSGSMQDPDKLPLVKSSLKLLTQQLSAKDRIALVVYAGASGVVLEPTSGDHKAKILAAIDHLEAGGSTNGAAGIELAYALARDAFIDKGVNRILLATDGDFNVGITDFQQLLDLVKTRRQSGIALTTLGFGTGNYNDELMEQLADAGDGNHAYIDSLAEAQKVLVRQRGATLQTVARDVKVQIEFNPAQVSEYRLIGYENRALQREDFSNDKVDAGDIGAGHSVTALYEIALSDGDGARVEPLRYGETVSRTAMSPELAHLRLRYKRPAEGTQAPSRLIERAVTHQDMLATLASAPASLRLAAAVAGFGQLLRGGKYTERFDYAAVADLVARNPLPDPHGDVGEFIKLALMANALQSAQVRSGDKTTSGG
jgi:Ca-activated chloride channel family protein